jgi:hypothetical protein
MREPGRMSNHYSAANLRFPGDDARLDLTDLYAFAAADPGKTVLIIDLNPFATGMSAMPPFLLRSDFHPDGVYRINVDRDGDAQAEAAFTFTFSERFDGRPTGTLLYATGAEARQPEPGGRVLICGTPVAFDDASARPVMAGPVRLFIGVRSDRSSPTPTAPSTASPGPGRTRSRARTSSRSRWRCCFSLRFAWMSDGKIPPQGLKPHDDLLPEFPYLGPPNVYPV